MNRTARILGIGLVLLAGDAWAITHADRDSGDDAVVALLTDGERNCTGTVIGRRTVLTAAHCAEWAPIEAVYFGSDTAAAGVIIPVADVVRHPSFAVTTDGFVDDVAVVVLAADAPAAPLPVAPAPAASTTLRLVGFGLPARDMAGTQKRSGTSAVVSVDDGGFDVAPSPSQPCLGDSGGPAFVGGAIVGVVSTGDAECSGGARLMRTDLLAEFIDGERRDNDVVAGGCALGRGASANGAWLLLVYVLHLARRHGAAASRQQRTGGEA